MMREGLARSVDAYLIDDKGLAIHLDHSAGNRKLADSDVMELVKSKPLVVDVRDNGGGNDDGAATIHEPGNS